MCGPLISEDTFRQEGWHYELDSTQGPMVFKGVVFNEMKGAYSSASAVLGKITQLSLYPDTTYGVNSGGDPKAIPDLTYEYFKNFHAKYYHPSNSRVVFYGDDDRDLLAFREICPGVPLLGAYGSGQIAPVGNGNRLFQNTVVTLLCESAHV